MKLQHPVNAPFAVDVPDLALEEITPGQEVTIDVDVVSADVVVSLLRQGWVPVDKPAKDLAQRLEVDPDSDRVDITEEMQSPELDPTEIVEEGDVR